MRAIRDQESWKSQSRDVGGESTTTMIFPIRYIFFSSSGLCLDEPDLKQSTLKKGREWITRRISPSIFQKIYLLISGLEFQVDFHLVFLRRLQGVYKQKWLGCI